MANVRLQIFYKEDVQSLHLLLCVIERMLLILYALDRMMKHLTDKSQHGVVKEGNFGLFSIM